MADTDADTKTCLFEAGLNSDIWYVKHWIDQGADVNQHVYGLSYVALPSETWGWWPLSAASALGHTEVVKLLLHAGADVDAIDDHLYSINSKHDGSLEKIGHGTALIGACHFKHKETAEILLAHGANTDAPKDEDVDALDVAYVHVTGGTSASESLELSRKSWILIDMLLAANADVPRKDSEIQARQRVVHQQLSGTTGLTPLMCCCIRGYTKCITRLLNAGADVGATDDQGYTALVHAVCNNQEGAVLMLLDLQADAELKQNVAVSEAELFARLEHVVIGQDAALKDIVRVLYQRKTGQTPDDRPLVLLFAGPSRCGKSEAAEQTSKVLFQQQTDHQLRFNMGQFQLEHEVSKLNGAPNGYQGSPGGELAILATMLL